MQKKRQIKGLESPCEHQPNAYVASQRYGLYGYADEIIHNDKQLVVVEYKHDKRPPTAAQRLQLVAYQLCAEEAYPGREIWGVLYKGGGRKQHRVDVKDEDIQTVKRVIQAIRRNSDSHRLPDSSAQAAQCDQCEYLRYCNDR